MEDDTLIPGTAEYDQYVARTIPEPLREGTPVPPSWPYDEASWYSLARLARRDFHGRAAYEFAFSIAVQGLSPAELATGELARGSEMTAGGEVHRMPEGELPADMIRDAGQLLSTVRQRGVALDRIILQRLELASKGGGTAKNVPPVLATVRSAIQQREAAEEALSREKQDKPVIHVHHAFSAMSKTFKAGSYTVEPEVAAELKDWQEKKESMAKARGWDAPEGWQANNWPPFGIVEAQPVR